MTFNSWLVMSIALVPGVLATGLWRRVTRRDDDLYACMAHRSALAEVGAQRVTRIVTVWSRIGTACLVAAIAMVTSASAATLSRSERLEHERQIAADLKADRARCDLLGGPEKSNCLDRAKVGNRVALAELAYNASGSQTDAGRLAVARRDADYAFARDRCSSRGNADRESCIRDAKAAHSRASAAAR